MVVTNFAFLALFAAFSSASPIPLNGMNVGKVFDGFGGLSAGASSRLLMEYPNEQRNQILEALFGPTGAQLSISKHEIGGDVQSTDGTEASYAHTATNVNFSRGYEFWLASAAKEKNPDVALYSLSWGIPYWVGQGEYFVAENIDYHVKWHQGASEVHGLEFDYTGIWNERSWGNVDWVLAYREALDAANFKTLSIVGSDGAIPKSQLDALKANASFRKAEPVLGRHYPCRSTEPELMELGITYWSSEDYSTVATWAGASCWGRSVLQNMVLLNATATIAWSTIWSVYPSFIYFGNGLMYAFEPWSGHYEVSTPIYTSAHIGQFTRRSWRFLERPGIGMLPQGGSYVVLTPSPASHPHNTTSVPRPRTVDQATSEDFSLLIEKLEGDCLRCQVPATTAETVEFQLGGGWEDVDTLFVFLTNETHHFIQLPSIHPSNGLFSIHVPRDTILSITTTTGQSKFNPNPPPPPPSRFPLPFVEDYESTPLHAPGKYHADNQGSWEVVENDGSGGGGTHVLEQQSPHRAAGGGWGPQALPITLFGDVSWRDVRFEASFRLGSPPNATGLFAGVCTRAPKRFNSGVCFVIGYNLVATGVVTNSSISDSSCAWVLGYQEASLDGDNHQQDIHKPLNSPSQQQPLQTLSSGPCPSTFSPTSFHSIFISTEFQSADAGIDGREVAGDIAIPKGAVPHGLVALRSSFHNVQVDWVNVTTSASSTPPPSTSLLYTSIIHGPARNDFSGWVGMVFENLTEAVEVNALGRFCGYISTTSHNLTIARISIGSTSLGTIIASTYIDMAVECMNPSAAGFVYSKLPNPVTLHPGYSYAIVSSENNNGDTFHGRSSIPAFFPHHTFPSNTRISSIYKEPNQAWSLGPEAPLGFSGTYGPVDIIMSQ